MKIKHVLSVHFLLIVLLLAVAFSGCGYNQRGVCVRNALMYGEYFKSKGYDIRYGHFKSKSKFDTSHMWCEYYDGKRWVRAIDTTPNRHIADWYGYEYSGRL